MASAPTTRKRLRPETTEFTPESTVLQSVLREIRQLREEQARREAEMAARERQRDEELQQLRIQLSRSYNISPDALREIDAAASGDAIVTAQSVNTIVSGGACVASRGANADASADVQVEFGLKLKPDTYDGTVPLREFFAQFELIARASHWNEMTKTVSLASCLRGKARAVLESVEDPMNLNYADLKSKLELRFGEGHLSQNFYSSFTSRKQKVGEDFASFGSDLERLCRLAYPEGTFALRDKIACSQFISGLVDNFIKKTLRLEGINSLKTAVVRARAIKEIQEECYDRGRGNSNFSRRNFFEKRNQGDKKIEEEKEGENGSKGVKNAFRKNKINDSSRKECWLCGKQGHFRFECPNRKGNSD